MPKDRHARATRVSIPLASSNATSPTHNPGDLNPDKGADRWISTDEACGHLDCHPRTLRRAIASGRLKAYRLGRTLKFRRRDLDAMLEPVITGSAIDESIGDFIDQQLGVP